MINCWLDKEIPKLTKGKNKIIKKRERNSCSLHPFVLSLWTTELEGGIRRRLAELRKKKKKKKMEAVAEGLWGLADYHESKGEIGKAVKCLEAICQSHVSFFPIVEVKTRLRIATILLKHSHNVNHAKSHLERSVSTPLSPFFLLDLYIMLSQLSLSLFLFWLGGGGFW